MTPDPVRGRGFPPPQGVGVRSVRRSGREVDLYDLGVFGDVVGVDDAGEERASWGWAVAEWDACRLGGVLAVCPGDNGRGVEVVGAGLAAPADICTVAVAGPAGLPWRLMGSSICSPRVYGLARARIVFASRRSSSSRKWSATRAREFPSPAWPLQTPPMVAWVPGGTAMSFAPVQVSTCSPSR